MTDTVKLNVNGDTVEVETKALTLICHRGDMNINPASSNIMVIGPEETVKRADKVTQSQWDLLRTNGLFIDCLKLVFPDLKMPLTLKNEGLGFRHVVGMLLLLHTCMVMGLQPYVRFPESYLHLQAQLGLADLFLKLQDMNNKIDRTNSVKD